MDIKFNESGTVRVGILVKCKQHECDKEFITRKSRPRSYCSLNCAQKAKIKREVISCSKCGLVFEKKPSQLKVSKSGLYFCTRKCKDEAQRIGGIEEIMPPHYGSSNGKHLSKHLLKNDPKCVSCGETTSYLLCVHHIDGDRENNTAGNLEIVCSNCHIKRHLKFNEKKKKWIYVSRYLTPRDKLDEV